MVPFEKVLIQDMVHIEDMELFFFGESVECVKQSFDVHLKEKIVKITSIQQIFGECVIIL